jgi:hypothetical protein
MTLKGNLNKISIALGIIITVVTLIAGVVRIIDLTQQTAETVDELSLRIENEQTERIAQDAILKDLVVKEREARSAEYTKIQVKLTEIDTRLLYIQQGIDSITK